MAKKVDKCVRLSSLCHWNVKPSKYDKDQFVLTSPAHHVATDCVFPPHVMKASSLDGMYLKTVQCPDHGVTWSVMHVERNVLNILFPFVEAIFW